MHFLFPNFLKKTTALGLRAIFDQRMENPLRSNPERFVWDFWHIPKEYTLLRTPAWEYFPDEIWQPFVADMQEFAQKEFGCRHLSPIWLSNYVSGCGQYPHQDQPHGPWAFVLPLNIEKKFQGGETFIFKKNKRILIKPEFNRLLVFNPSLKHGVLEVKKNLDPRHGRLVLHGWFTDPKPFAEGNTNREVDKKLSDFYSALHLMSQQLPSLKGFIAWHVYFQPNGKIRKIERLPNTFSPEKAGKKMILAAESLLGEIEFRLPPKKLTIPWWM